MGVAAIAGGLAVAAPAPSVASTSPDSDETQPVEQVEPGPDAASAADEAAAFALAVSSGDPVEILSMRTESEQTFALPDGTFLAQQYFGPQFVLTDGDGTDEADWELLDTSLITHASGEIGPAVYPSDVQIGAGGDAQILEMELRDTGVEVELLWRGGELPEPVLDGHRATFPSVIDGVDLVVGVQPTGFEQFFIVHTPAALESADALGFDIVVTGGAVLTDAEGEVQIIDETGNPVAAVPTAMMWDADADLLQAEPVLDAAYDDGVPLPGPESSGVTFLNALDAATTPQAPGAEAELPIDIDTSLDTVSVAIEDPAEISEALGDEFPLVLDPSLTNSFDTYVNSNYPTTTYYSNSDFRLGTWDSGNSVYRSYLNFHTDGIAGYDITNAWLNIWNYHSWTCSSRSWYISIAEAVGTSTTWNNQPTVYAERVQTNVTKGYSSSCPAGYTNANITSLLQLLALHPTNVWSLQLRALNESDNTYWKKFYSREYSDPSKRPYISYTYQRPPVPTEAGMEGNLTTMDCDFVDDWDDIVVTLDDGTTPTVSARVADWAGGEARGVFTVLHIEVPAQGDLPAWDQRAVVYGTWTSSGWISTHTFTGDLAMNEAIFLMVQSQNHNYALSEPMCSKVFAVENEIPEPPHNFMVDGQWTTGGDTFAITDTTPTISAVVSDPEGADVSAYFRVHDHTGAVVDAGLSDEVSSGGRATWTMTTELEPGIEYYVTAKTRDLQPSGQHLNSYRDSEYSDPTTWWFELSDGAPSAPTSVELNGAAPASTGTVTLPGSYPQFSGIVTDPDGDATAIAVLVYADGVALNGADQIIGASAWGSAVSTAVLPFALQPGIAYTFELFGWDGAQLSDTSVTLPATYTVDSTAPDEVPTWCDTQTAPPSGTDNQCGGGN